jgi:hypothetical protein
MITDKLNRYIAEFEYRDNRALEAKSFDDIVKKLVAASEIERQNILKHLKGGTKKKIETMIKGGLI